MSAVVGYFETLSRRSGEAWNQFWFTPASPLPLARLRIATGLIVLIWLATWMFQASRLFAANGLVPADMVEQLLKSQNRHLFHVSPLFYVHNSAELLGYTALSMAVAALFTAGVFTRVTSALTLLAVLSFIHRAPMLTGPLETVLAMLMLYLTLGPCGAALSFDHWRTTRAQPADLRPSWLANVSLRLLQVHVAGLLLLIACSMLAAVTWWDGTAIWHIEARELSRPLDLLWLRKFPKLVNGWTHLFVLVNLLFPVLVWNRLLRPLVVLVTGFFWLSMIPISGEVLYVLAMLTALAAFLPRGLVIDDAPAQQPDLLKAA